MMSNRAMYDAAKDGNVEALMTALAQRDQMQFIDTPDPERKQTALFLGASNGHAEIINALVQLGSKAVDTPTADGWTPMLIAALNGRVPVIQALAQLGSKAIDTPNREGQTSLYLAASHGHVSAIEALVQQGSRVIDVPDKNGRTPLSAAASNGHVSAVETLVRLGSQAIDAPDNDGKTPLFVGTMNGHDSAIETLVRLGSQAIDIPDHNGWTPMYAAAISGRVSLIEMLVRLGSKAIDSPDNVGRTPMIVAAWNGHASAIETIVRLGSNAIDTPENKGITPLNAAATNGHVSVVELLFRSGTKAINTPDTEYQSRPLKSALCAQPLNARLISALLEAGADIASIPSMQLETLSSISSQIDHPAMQLFRFFNSGTKALCFPPSYLTNQKAAYLSLEHFKSCRLLDFRNNPDLTEIPVFLAVFDPNRTKVQFDAEGNWSSFERSIIQSGSRAIIEYAKLKAEGSDLMPINECKLMVVGFAAVGKTTLVRRLKTESYSHPVSTDGVDMGELTLPTGKGETMRVVIWDFAGQPLYRHAHMLFSRNPGLCLLLFKLTDGVNKSVEQLQYWCDSLRSHNLDATASRVLLIGTHLDRFADRSMARQKADQVRFRLEAFLPINEPPILVSCVDGPENQQTINDLRAAILRISLSIQLRAPACLEVVRNALRSSSSPLLTIEKAHETIATFAEQANHTKLAKQEQLREICLRALQTLGSVLPVENRGRTTHVVVNPQWVAKLLTTVVTTRPNVLTRGRITFSKLSSQIWRGNALFPLETHPTLVTILEQLKIMFPLGERQHGGSYLPSQVFFVPSSLPEQRPDSRFSGLLLPPLHRSHQLRRLFKLTEPNRSVQYGVMLEVIAQLMTTPNMKMVEVWQQGGVFRSEQSSSTDTFIISVSRVNICTIEVVVQSSQQSLAAKWIRELSTMVENQLTDVHGLAFEVRLPCLEAEDSCFVLLDDVRSRIVQQQLRFRCCEADDAHFLEVEQIAPDQLFSDVKCQPFIQQWSDIELTRQLGRGAYGKVMLGSLTQTAPAETRVIAVKMLERKERHEGSQDQHRDSKMFQEFQHEAFLMSLLHHPNIVQIVGVCFPSLQPQVDHQRSSALLMEVVGGGTLYNALTDAAGVVKICMLADELIKVIGKFNSALNLHTLNPIQNQHPGSLDDLDKLCDGALGRIEKTFEKIFNHPFTAGANAPVDKLLELQQQLSEKLATLHKGPVTSKLYKETEQFIDEIQKMIPVFNELLGPITWPLRLKLATDVAQGLMHMHSLTPPLAHRDFKSPNVFLTQRLDGLDLTRIDWRQPLAKVGDFGLSIRMLGTSELRATEQHAVGNINPTWAAPEVLSHQAYSIEADVYAMGITMWELLTRDSPFSDITMDFLREAVIAGRRPSCDSINTEGDQAKREYVELMQQCWHKDKHQRPAMTEVIARLRALCVQIAPEVGQSLPPEPTPAPPVQPETSRKPTSLIEYQVADVQSLSLADTEVKATKVFCLQWVDAKTCWLGMNWGTVAMLQFGDDQIPPRSISCSPTDCHEQDVTAMCYNPSQRMTVWSGGKNGRIFVWSSQPETLEEAKTRCFVKTKFLVVKTKVKKLKKFKRRALPLHCVARNGWMHFYPDEHVGPPRFEFDMCRADLVASVQPNGNLKLDFSQRSQMTLQPADFDGDESQSPAHEWKQVIDYLAHVNKTGWGLPRLAVSAGRNTQASITALEATDQSTWCLSLDSLEEWMLTETHHGWHSQTRLKQGRSLTFDWRCPQLAKPRLRSVNGLAWVTQDVLWVGAANTIAIIDLTQPIDEQQTQQQEHQALERHSRDRRAIELKWPAESVQKHTDPVRLLTLVKSPRSPSGFEVWTYAQNVILVWQTPLSQSPDLTPVLLDRLLMSQDAPALTCLKQVGSQVWAGNEEGTVVGWDIATRAPLEERRVPWPHRKRTTAIAAVPIKKGHSLLALSASSNPTLHKYVLESVAQAQPCSSSLVADCVRQ